MFSRLARGDLYGLVCRTIPERFDPRSRSDQEYGIAPWPMYPGQ